MATVPVEAITEVLDKVKTWPEADRMSLALRILRGIETSGTRRETRGRPVNELIGLGAGTTPGPDDQTVKQWIHEYRMEKYG